MDKKDMLCKANKCPTYCQCFYNVNELVHVVDCFNVTWKDPVANLPQKSTTVFLDGNTNIAPVVRRLLIGLSNLEILYINNSGLRIIHRDLFQGVPNLKELHLEDNQLYSISGDEFDFTPKLQELFLNQNELHFLSPNAFWNLSKLKILSLHKNKLSQPQLWTVAHNLSEITFSQNPFICTCNFVIPLQQWVGQTQDIQFQDVANTYCNDELHTPIMQYNDSTCYEIEVIKEKKISLLVIIAPTVSIFLFLSILSILLYLYRLEMKVWLYSRYGVRLFYTNKDADKGKVFHAFISYANEDGHWIAGTLVPQLTDYKLCIHQRDFPVGGFIAESIVEAVEKSQWCQFEFNTAHMQSLQDKCKRLIVVLYQEVDKNINDALFWSKKIRMSQFCSADNPSWIQTCEKETH
uniref:TIR domain-containing protein n=1 Tax=Strigamia maritima TaxID=126957 RepID=T1ILV0_STRMM